MDYPMAADEDWPEAWLMPAQTVSDQCKPNRLEPNVPVTAGQLKEIGICFWKMEDVDKYDYPIKSVPWDPSDAADPKLQGLRDARGYSYADIITVHPDHLPEFEAKIASFFEEHIHDAEEIRYVLGGSGYFDVRDKQDRWVRVHVKKGDLLTLPEGIYHRRLFRDLNVAMCVQEYICCSRFCRWGSYG
jgi:1,2-dihydroxy-3-keto-5-methylthiopentene dioxygenase